MCSVFEAEKCSMCINKAAGCEYSCRGYSLHGQAYDEALKMYEDISLGVPKGHCRGCQERYAGCHDECWDYILEMEYRHICKEEMRKQKANDSIQHTVGLPGLPYGSRYSKSKNKRYAY